MAYCDQSDLTERYGDKELKELTDESAGSTISAQEVTAACDEASSDIDVYLGVHYPVPLALPPAAVKGWACVLARLKLWGGRAVAESPVRIDADAVLKLLRDIATGKGTLPGQTAAVATLAAGTVAVAERTQFMSDTTLDKMLIGCP